MRTIHVYVSCLFVCFAAPWCGSMVPEVRLGNARTFKHLSPCWTMLDKRDATSKEGIALLKRGATVIKFSRVGKASVATLRLSADEQLLTWRGKDSGFKLINKDNASSR